MRIGIRTLKNKTLSEGYISASLFEIPPAEIFVCIWPSEPTIVPRARLAVRRRSEEAELREIPGWLEKAPLAGDYELVLTNHWDFLEPGRCYRLEFRKTATVFDHQGFFWNAAKGHHFAVTSGQFEPDSALIFRADRRNHNNGFFNLLQIFGEATSGGDVDLSDFFHANFDIVAAGTYGFAVYLQVDFHCDEIRFNGSREKIYRLGNGLPPDLAVKSILYKYPAACGEQRRSQPKVYVSEYLDHYADTATARASSIQSRSSQETQLDILTALKHCFRDFFQQFRDRTPNDEDYRQLIFTFLERLHDYENDSE